jgi:glycine hydroxymethyltransferase
MFDRAQTLDHTDSEKPFVTSGVRLVSPAITTRGFGVEEAVATAHLIADTLDSPQDVEVHARVRSQVAALTGRFPVYSPPAA